MRVWELYFDDDHGDMKKGYGIFLISMITRGVQTMVIRIWLILLCLGILSTVNGCYVEPYPYGYYAPRPYVYTYPQSYVYGYPRRYYVPY